MRNMIHILLVAICFSVWSCSKQDEFLDEKYNLSDVVPQTLEEFQLLLDNDGKMNSMFSAGGQLGSDNYYVPEQYLSMLPPMEKNGYTWVKDIYEGQNSPDWDGPYGTVVYSNVVLEGLEKLKGSQVNSANFNQVKGSALFFRAFAFYNLAQTFCKPYSSTADKDMGIVLRMTSDIHAKSVRATLSETYNKIITDLVLAETLLPALPLKPTRPSKASAFAMLAKIYLNMGDYAKTEEYANKSLTIQNALLDFKTVPVDILPFTPYYNNNPEFVFYAMNNGYGAFSPFGLAYVDSLLYKSYEDNDLRKTLFYYDNPGPPAGMYFLGSYAVGMQFGGIGTNELYLIKAEAQARQNKVSDGLITLNSLLEKRYKAPYTPKTAANQTDALLLVLQERRKELPFTSQIRWEDLRRLNLDPALAITLKRVVGGNTITLPPNDPRYVLPIPDNEIRLSGLQQNNR